MTMSIINETANMPFSREELEIVLSFMFSTITD
jgi:hypothetical protein